MQVGNLWHMRQMKKMQFSDLKAKIELSQLHKLTFSAEWKLKKNLT